MSFLHGTNTLDIFLEQMPLIAQIPYEHIFDGPEKFLQMFEFFVLISNMEKVLAPSTLRSFFYDK